jgi:hypothetical protein
MAQFIPMRIIIVETYGTSHDEHNSRKSLEEIDLKGHFEAIGIEVVFYGEIFSFCIYSRDYWEENLAHDHPPSYGFYIMDSFDKDTLIRYINTTVDHCSIDSNSYAEFALKLSKIWFWEFEGYNEQIN